jgi:hypothetical protein
METQQSLFCHNWHSWNDRQRNLSQWYSTTDRFQTYPFTLHHCQIVTDCTTQKELTIHKIHKGRYSTPLENPDTSETTQIILKSTQTTKKEIAIKKERFFITNITKGHKLTDLTRPNVLGKLTDLTRPNVLGTTMSKVATKSPGRTRLWKRLRAPSHNTVENNQLRYTVVFKGRTQCIQDGYQQHSGTTRTRRGS